jgi:hypothetical protein
MKEIKLTQNMVALVDDEDFENLNRFKWCVSKRDKTHYACRAIYNHDDQSCTIIQMQKQIIDSPLGMEIDHIDGNGLNNQKSNLRACTHQQNQMNRALSKNNSSGFKGVSLYKGRNKWNSYIKVNYKKINLGYFKTKEEAALTYNAAALKHFGEFANLNEVSKEN